MILTRTPLRVSLAGGGTDLPEYYRQAPYGAVCSIAINKYVYCSVKELPTEFSYSYKLAYSTTELKTHAEAISHPILKAAITTSGIERLDFNSMADIPAGTGMGSSSSFSVGTINALSLLKGTLLTKEQLAKAACDLEMKTLRGSLGKQDQYAAAYGGINLIYFNPDETVQVKPIILDEYRSKLIFTHLRLYYLGAERSAEDILKTQVKSGAILDEMRSQALRCTDILTHGIVEELGRLLHAAWQLKMRLSPHISSLGIDALYNSFLSQGAYGGKLLGAGGAGYMLICCPPDLDLITHLKRVDFRPDYQGSVGFYI